MSELLNKISELIKRDKENIYCIMQLDNQYCVTLFKNDTAYVVDKELDYYDLIKTYSEDFIIWSNKADIIYQAETFDDSPLIDDEDN